jgi:tRNA(Ile)-lysidine synthase
MDALGAEAFDRRLEPGLDAPVAVALSGGGDSLAVLLAAKAWAARRGRRLIALTVDHQLRAESAGWTAFCARVAARLEIAFRALTWEGDKPAHGLPAAARAARHRLLADAAREAGARVIVLGHTADDILEADLMRAWGSSLGQLREWAPSPAWPEGRSLFLLRPLLGARRAAIRDWLTARGEAWIDDPGNIDAAQTRARARARIAGGGAAAAIAREDSDLSSLAGQVVMELGGMLSLERDALRVASGASARRWLAAAALSAGGGSRPPRGARIEALAERLRGAAPVKATLRGARIVADDRRIRIVRDAGEAARGGLAPLTLALGEPGVWDGRFELTADRAGLSVRPLAGLATRLDPTERRALGEVHTLARPALPAVIDGEGRVSCPVLADASAAAQALIWPRMAAACGAILTEPAT